jgi:S-adenosylmethionine:tRNA ribosyltransferase-isomerase
VDALLVRRIDERRWEALLDTPRKLAAGERLKADERSWARIVGKTADGKWVLEFDTDPDLSRLGRAPLPPYIRRDATAADLERYQTVYAKHDGSIAAPTAGLHFTNEMLAVLAAKVEIVRITLHVGVGTFKPVKAENVEDHRMEPERYDIRPDAEAVFRRAIADGRRVVAVGTTTCRTLETWIRTDRAAGDTDLFIHPPFEFRAVRALLTNFHLPKSTLLMLACAFAGRERILAAYEEAIRQRYRFFSYGDAMLVE